MRTFHEWLNEAHRPKKSRPVSVKNKDIDAFLKAVDNLKRDMEELDVLEKKPKKKSVPGKEPVAVEPDQDDDDSLDVRDPGEPLRLPPDDEVPGESEDDGGKPSRPDDSPPRRLVRSPIPGD